MVLVLRGGNGLGLRDTGGCCICFSSNPMSSHVIAWRKRNSESCPSHRTVASIQGSWRSAQDLLPGSYESYVLALAALRHRSAGYGSMIPFSNAGAPLVLR